MPMPAFATRHSLSTDFITFGSDASTDNLTAMSQLFLYRYRVGGGTSRCFASKGVTNGWSIRQSSTGANLQFLWNRATTDLSYITSSSPGPLTLSDRWRWLAVTADQAGDAGDLIRVYTDILGPVGKPVRWQTHTFGTATDGADAFDSDASNNVTLGCQSNGTANLAGDIAFWALWNTRKTPKYLADFAMNPLRFRNDTLILAFPGSRGSRVLQNHGTLGIHGTINGAQAIQGPPWAPWTIGQHYDDDPPAAAAAPTGGGALGSGIVSSPRRFGGNIVRG